MVEALNKGHYLVGTYEGIKLDEGGYKRIHVRASEGPEARSLDLAFKPFSEFDGRPTIDDDVSEGDLVIVRVYNEVQLYQVGKRAGNPTGETAGFIKRSALRVSRLDA
jgi:hypothetical protein